MSAKALLATAPGTAPARDDPTGLGDAAREAIERRVRLECLFAWRLADVSTQAYLEDPVALGLIEPAMAPYRVSEAWALHARLSPPPPPPPPPGMRIVLTNWGLRGFAGSELWTLEMASALVRAGCSVMIYSPAIGQVARDRGDPAVRLTDAVDDVVAFAPDLLHVHHAVAVLPLIERLAGRCRIVNLLHGLTPALEVPLGQGVDRYCAVSLHAKAKITLLTDAAWDDVPILPNFFDPARFVQRTTVARPHRALLLSSRTPPEAVARLRMAVQKRGIQLDHIGYGGVVTARPEDHLGDYDLVFATGRSAIEALASGCRVVIWDGGIVGPLVTSEGLWRTIAANFAIAAGILHHAIVDEHSDLDGWLDRELTYDRADQEHLVGVVRECLTVDRIGAHLMNIYGALVSPRRDLRAEAGAATDTVAAEHDPNFV